MELTNFDKFLNEEVEKNKEMTITVKNLAEHQYKAFVELLYAIDVLGSIGSSREVKAFVDGDGSFRADILIDGKAPSKILDKESADKLKSDMSNDKINIGGFE